MGYCGVVIGAGVLNVDLSSVFDRNPAFRVGIADVMSFNRFRALRRTFHFSRNNSFTPPAVAHAAAHAANVARLEAEAQASAAGIASPRETSSESMAKNNPYEKIYEFMNHVRRRCGDPNQMPGST